MGPTRTGDPAKDRQLLLRHAERCAEQVVNAVANRDVAVRAAHEAGASRREIGEAVGSSHTQIGRRSVGQ